MAKAKIPVFNIDQFGHQHDSEEFYANTIAQHLKYHHFVNTPHKHDFFLTMLFTKGKGSHEIDFVKYDVKPGSVFMMLPGQTHSWKLSKDIEGYIFFHTREFFDLHFSSIKTSDYPFFHAGGNSALLQLNKKQNHAVKPLFEEIVNEQSANEPLKSHKLRALVNGLYIDLARFYSSRKSITAPQTYLVKLNEFEALLEKNYKEIKSPKEYSELLIISERHLNRICKVSLNKTSTDIITGRIILEAKRLLVNTNLTVAEIAADLGYYDSSYFSRLFKKGQGETPVMFRTRMKFPG